MLWDMIRYQNFDETSPYNREAAAWAKHQTYFQLPIDARPLRDKLARATSIDDLIPIAAPVAAKPAKSKSSPGRSPQPPVRQPTAPVPATSDVLFIDDSDPIPAQVVPQSRRASGDDILFIE
jgi:hypothetical protein